MIKTDSESRVKNYNLNMKPSDEEGNVWIMYEIKEER